jgi:hypothetical protein
VRRHVLEGRRDALLQAAFRAEVEIEAIQAQTHSSGIVVVQRAGQSVSLPVGSYIEDLGETRDNGYAAAGRLAVLIEQLDAEQKEPAV